VARRQERVTFTGSSGAELGGVLVLPEGAPLGSALFAHCFTCDSTSHAATRVSRALADRGWAVLRFDFTGLGESEGEFADTTFTTNIEDVRAAARFLEERFGGPQLLVGHSLGGAAVLMAAESVPEAVAVVTIGAPADPEHVLELVEGATAAEGDDRIRVNIGGRPFEIGTAFVDDIRAHSPAECMARTGKALLILHAPGDTVVGIDNARVIYDRARHPKSFVTLDGADHLLSRREDSAYVAEVVTAWASRYLPAAASEPASDHRAQEWERVTVQEDDPRAFAHTAGVRAHRWRLDEPTDVGGGDTGPNPYEVLLSALGACTSMTLRMYARKKGWEFGATRVELAHDRIHAADCEDCETEVGRVDRIQRTIHLDPALDAETRDRLLEIADRCPVHRTLTGEIVISTDSA